MSTIKVKLNLSLEQARTLEKALELYARIGMSQLYDLEYHPSFEERNYDKDKVRDLLFEVKREVFRDLPHKYQHYGITNENTHKTSKQAYDMYQVLRYSLAWHFNPEGNNWSVLYDQPDQFSEESLMECLIEEDSD